MSITQAKKVTNPQTRIKQFDMGKASKGSNSCTPRRKAEYTVPPPIPHAVAKAELTLSTRTSNSSRG